jgi:hypothetical protein
MKKIQNRIKRIRKQQEIKYRDIKNRKRRGCKILSKTFQVYVKKYPIRNLISFSEIHYRLQVDEDIDYWPSTGTVRNLQSKKRFKMSLDQFINLTKTKNEKYRKTI